MNPSPLRYPGGKYKLYKYASELVKKNNCSTYIEPFCGGSAIALKLLFDGVVKNIIINDYDYGVFCFWKSILEQTENFTKMILDVEVTIQEWYKQKAIRSNFERHTELEIGFSTFFLNRANRSGIIDKAGPIGGYDQKGKYLLGCRFNKLKLIEKINKIAEHGSGIKIYNLEALKFIEEIILKRKKTFVFFDPPYYSKGPGLYKNFYSHEDHVNLANEIMHKLKNRKWIVTYDNMNEIKSMYKKVENVEFQLQYTLQKKCLGMEVMFFSKKISRLEKENEYLQIISE